MATNTTIKQIFNELSNEINENEVGQILFTYHNLSIVLNDKSAIGYILQEWLGKWFTSKNFLFDTNSNTQEPPDFFIGKDRSHLELKSFDMEACPNFDIANFEAYCSMLSEDPTLIDADYLILGYTLIDGKLKIKQMWLKKIWEISCGSARYPLKTQIKRDMIYNIRPATWYAKSVSFPVFKSKKEFLEAIQKTLSLYPKTKKTHKKWLLDIKKKYKFLTKKDLF